MRSRRKRSKRMNIMHLWTRSEASKAVPYLRSVIGSLREHWLDVLNIQRKIDRSASQKAPARRQQILERETLHDECHRAQVRFDDALEELNGVEVYLLDPVQGLALMPFRKEDDLAWFVFDQFASRGLVGWRFHSDPIEECRPMASLKDPVVKDKQA